MHRYSGYKKAHTHTQKYSVY